MDSKDAQTHWRSIWIDTALQGVLGIQFGIYMLITWPYFMEIDETATISFLGAIVAASSLGSAMCSPVYGLWTARTSSTRQPVSFGFTLAILGNLLYVFAPSFDKSHIKYVLLVSRFIIGCGAGSMTSLESFIANASTQKDRLKAVSYSSGGYSLGILMGPAIPSVFTYLPAGLTVGGVAINTYSTSAFFMMALCVGCIVVLNSCFEEIHAGVMSEEEQEAKQVTLPRVDCLALAICMYISVLVYCFETAIESLQSALTITLYDWTNEESIRYNGIITALSCCGDLLTYVFLTQSRFKNIDRRIQVTIGLSAFVLFYALHVPWPIYERLETGEYVVEPSLLTNSSDLSTLLTNATAHYSGEKCYERYTWCSTTYRLPLPVYFFIMTAVLPIAFPLLNAPVHTLFSEIIGPRPQGIYQGALSSMCNFGQFLAPIIVSYLFEVSGYLWITIGSFLLCLLGLALLLAFYERLVPLKVVSRSKTSSETTSDNYEKGTQFMK